uniref:Heavy metal translocating P-type ATPase n=1 Tax=uncultured organism TaxID=155900 RepID=M1PPJ8_9ZZZZ|nr:heavy metal translocating P-type ATPase [uncultured organism]
MEKEADECPYCEARIRDLDKHIELQHEELSLWRFFLDSKNTVLTGFILLISLTFLLLDSTLSLTGFAVYKIFMAMGIIVGGVPLVREAIHELIDERTFDVDALVIVAAVGAVMIGYWSEAAVLVFLFSIAERLEDYSVFRSRRSLKELLDLSPTEARVLKDGKTNILKPEEVDLGDVVIVKPGERIPVDGKIKEGNSAIDESPITGESVPKEKEIGDEVFAGTLNKEGLLKISTTKRSRESTLSRIVEMVEDAEARKADTEKFINRFARYYTPAILVMAVMVFTVPVFLFDLSFEQWLYRALILLVLSCPCAFVVSTPVTMVSAVTKSAKEGLLIKGSIFLEKIKDTKTVVFDKTGTLTTGDFAVTEIIPLAEMEKKKIALVSKSLESYSDHPLAGPIVEYAERLNGEDNYEVEEFSSLSGTGIKGTIEDETYRIGNPDIFDIDEKVERKINELTSEGKTVVVLGNDEGPIALIALEDTIREGAREIIAKLKEHGVEPIMLTGDNEKTAAAVAKKLGIERYISNVLPDEKLEEIEKLQEEGHVTMIGDGVNDAPALVKSDVGIAMGAAGSDTAMESADMALMEDDLSKLDYLFNLSEKTMRVVKENVMASIGVKFALAVLTFFGLVTLWIAVGVGDVGMALLVTFNALLLGKR